MQMKLRYPLIIFVAVALVAIAFHFWAPLEEPKTDETFLPKAEYVKVLSAGHNVTASGIFWIKGLVDLGGSYLTGQEYAYLGHVGELATSLDSLFYTPYYFVGGVVPIQSKDTSDYSVMRRATKTFPNDWRLALYFAIRLANGPYKQNAEAADVMRPFSTSTDTAMPEYVRTIYRTFELGAMQTEIALQTVVEDCTNPAFATFKSSLKARARRILGYGSMSTSDEVKMIDTLIAGVMAKQVHPMYAYQELLKLKYVAPDTTATADSTGAPIDSSNAPVDTTAALTDSSKTFTDSVKTAN